MSLNDKIIELVLEIRKPDPRQERGRRLERKDSQIDQCLTVIVELQEEVKRMENWTAALCVLLDRIALSSSDESEVSRLCAQRFCIAKDHGMTVTFGSKTSSEIH